GLRPEAAREARAVAKAARALGLEAAVLRWEGAKPATGVQAAARIARYDLMAAHSHAHGIGAIVTAHHLEDQAETLVMRLARGSGVDGLSGIAGRIAWAGIPVLRPLLTVPRARLRAMLEAQGLSWIEDPSNEDRRFERVRVRAALKQLETLGITGEALARSARRMARAREALDRATESFMATHASVSPAGYCTIDRGALREAAEEIALRALARVLLGVGGGASRIASARLEALAAALRAGEPAVRTLGGCRIEATHDRVVVTRESGRAGLAELRIRPGERALWDRRFSIGLSETARGPVTVRALGRKGLGAVRARCGRAVSLPGQAAAGLAAFWRRGEVIAVPALGFAAEGTSRESGCFHADFVALGASQTIKAIEAKASPRDGHEGMNS
ncbi:MAG: tRNA lysidine(34) synthetase TilS, partial [Hyphomicrobiales bacterium]